MTAYGYQFRDLILARVRARNYYGYSNDYSQVNTQGALLRTTPQAMGTIYVDAFKTTSNQVSVYWNNFVTSAQKGDSEIISYTLAMSSDNGITWRLLTGIGSGT